MCADEGPPQQRLPAADCLEAGSREKAKPPRRSRHCRRHRIHLHVHPVASAAWVRRGPAFVYIMDVRRRSASHLFPWPSSLTDRATAVAIGALLIVISYVVVVPPATTVTPTSYATRKG